MIYDFAKLRGIEVTTNDFIEQGKIVFMGNPHKTDLFGAYKISVLDIYTGILSGNCPREEVRTIVVSEKNRSLLASYISQGKRIGVRQ